MGFHGEVVLPINRTIAISVPQAKVCRNLEGLAEDSPEMMRKCAKSLGIGMEHSMQGLAIASRDLPYIQE